MLGHALGDALCAPFEGLPAEAIARDLGGARRHLERPPPGEVLYTDDTQQMIGVAECLIDHGRIDADAMIGRFVGDYQEWRGYGQGARRLIEAAAAGADPATLATLVFPDGSYGNGAAMRATPVGLSFHADLAEVKRQARTSALPTHAHPLAVDGAVVFAAAVALCVRGGPFDRGEFFAELEVLADEEEYRWQLRTAGRLRDGDAIPFGSSLPAHRSVVSALCCFARSPDSFLDAIVSATVLGDDTDTLAGMAGALVGARRGARCIPATHLARLEDGTKGRTYIAGLAARLCDGSKCRG